ncbi:MAG: hypothetical protein II902_09000 [Selenomonadaceae bacterium]|nr:hypothetical protein [Selenomonadaceae bacterium]
MPVRREDSREHDQGGKSFRLLKKNRGGKKFLRGCRKNFRLGEKIAAGKNFCAAVGKIFGSEKKSRREKFLNG